MHPWPALSYDQWHETLDTVHMWLQMVGKIRLQQTKLVNHWWNVPLYVTARGLSTSAVPGGDRTLEFTFDFIDHQLVMVADDGRREVMELRPRTVADFYHDLVQRCGRLGLEVHISTLPCELEHPLRFDKDEVHHSYDADAVHRFWQVLVASDRVLHDFRADFIGKCSPVHFFWGAMDLAVTRFSGRRAARPGADKVTAEGYSHEVISHGFWPGNASFPHAAFYAYAAPEPPGFASGHVSTGSYNSQVKEFILLYDDMRQSPNPDQTLSNFLHSTYDLGATLAAWDRPSLER